MLKIKFLIIIFLCSFSLYAFDDEPELDDDGNPIITADVAPDWQVSNKHSTFSSTSLVGKPYVLHFWATWCPYCKRLQPGLETISKSYLDKGIATYAISFWENPRAKPTDEMAKRGLSFKVIEGGDEVAKLFNVQSTPTTIFINHHGEISARYLMSDPNDPQLRLDYEILLDEFNKKDNNQKESKAVVTTDEETNE